MILWTITTFLVWVIFIACLIEAFHDNLFTTWYALFLTGPSFILFIYCLSFLFSSADSASRQAFLVLVLLILIPMIISIVIEEIPLGLRWVYSFFPPISIYQIFSAVLVRIGIAKQDLKFYFEDESAQNFFIMQYITILLYGFILFIIEKVRIKLQARSTKRTFGDYGEFFKKERAKHPITDETHQMEELITGSHEFAVRIENISRLFQYQRKTNFSSKLCFPWGEIRIYIWIFRSKWSRKNNTNQNDYFNASTFRWNN
jgi:hypothetical protein